MTPETLGYWGAPTAPLLAGGGQWGVIGPSLYRDPICEGSVDRSIPRTSFLVAAPRSASLVNQIPIDISG